MESTKNNLKHYWINCNKHESRRKEMELQFTKLNLKNERIEGCTPETLPKIIYPIKHTQSQVEVACTCSHLKAIQKGLESGDEWFIVMEDDVKIVCDIDFETLIKTHKHDGIYQLATNGHALIQNVLHDLYLKNIQFVNWNLKLYGTLSYLINRDTAKKLINKYIKNNNVYDFSNEKFLVSDVLIYKNGNTITSTYPLYCTEIENISTIHANHDRFHSSIMKIVINFMNKVKPPLYAKRIV
jgi:GR25 family glycosyltransferase involved in LPS biosynthesis